MPNYKIIDEEVYEEHLDKWKTVYKFGYETENGFKVISHPYFNSGKEAVFDTLEEARKYQFDFALT